MDKGNSKGDKESSHNKTFLIEDQNKCEPVTPCMDNFWQVKIDNCGYRTSVE